MLKTSACFCVPLVRCAVGNIRVYSRRYMRRLVRLEKARAAAIEDDITGVGAAAANSTKLARAMEVKRLVVERNKRNREIALMEIEDRLAMAIRTEELRLKALEEEV